MVHDSDGPTVYKEAFAEELSVRKAALSEERPYTDILTEDTTYINGPLSFYYRNIDSYVGPNVCAH